MRRQRPTTAPSQRARTTRPKVQRINGGGGDGSGSGVGGAWRAEPGNLRPGHHQQSSVKVLPGQGLFVSPEKKKSSKKKPTISKNLPLQAYGMPPGSLIAESSRADVPGTLSISLAEREKMAEVGSFYELIMANVNKVAKEMRAVEAQVDENEIWSRHTNTMKINAALKLHR